MYFIVPIEKVQGLPPGLYPVSTAVTHEIGCTRHHMTDAVWTGEKWTGAQPVEVLLDDKQVREWVRR